MNAKFAVDLALWALCGAAAFFLRVDDAWPRYAPTMLAYVLVGLPFKALLLRAFGLDRQAWRKVSVPDMYRLLQAVGAGTLLLFTLGLLVFFPYIFLPRSVPLIEGVLAALALGEARLFRRLLYERRGRMAASAGHKRVLLVGAGEAGTLLAREMLRHPEAGLVPAGFLDDDSGKQQTRFFGLPVLGRLDDLARVAQQQEIDEVLIAMPSVEGGIVRRVLGMARAAGLPCRSIPGLYDILSGRVAISQIREVEVEDLLRRKPAQLNIAQISDYLRGRVVLVTGAGGSIGAEIVRQTLAFAPGQMLLLGRGENSLYSVENEVKRTHPGMDVRTLVADVRDRARLEHIFRQYRPQVVFHVAAHKHVPLMEANPDEAVLNNVGGTQHVAELALHYGAARFVNISTDKAINPTSIMGASKRAAEMVVERVAQQAQAGQMFVSVRFGNVLGSRGSVVPLFKEQIARGGPLLVTHPEMTRYFMTIPEAAQLVLQAGGLDQNGALYVLDMGAPLRIVDLARDMILLSGLRPDVDIAIQFTGIRPGEKLFEEILSREEGTYALKHASIYVVSRAQGLPADFEARLQALYTAARAYDSAGIRAAFAALIPTYRAEG
ncbi:MAG: polysaccharide biosynthesis protein [Chloroflexi bacterium]|nr:polysaccharide biosynthesis protein [Chloroflexota bacterium]